MPVRISGPLAVATLALLAACSHADDGQVADASPLDCKLSPQAVFERSCQVDRMATPDGTVLTVRRPDGGFRRLLIVKDGRGVIAADGTEPVEVRSAGGKAIDVEADGTTYRLPARVTK